MNFIVDSGQVATALETLRAKRPRVHCITNAVAQNYTANMLLALGVTPSMTVAPREIPSFVSGADALLVNLGTLDRERLEGIELAIQAAQANAVPWILDPVLVNRSPDRLDLARLLLLRRPRILRVNAEEFAALSGRDEAPGAFAARNLTAVALTGAVDTVSDGIRTVRVSNGHELMTRVTAMGCAATAVAAAFLAVEPAPVRAAACALAAVGVAGELAARTARGPGSFAAGMLDALYSLDRQSLADLGRIEIVPPGVGPAANDTGVTMP